MRYWIAILMLAIAVPLIPIFRKAIVPTVSVASHLIKRNASKVTTPFIATAKTSLLQSEIMTESIPQQNPLPVLSKAAPADPIKAQELPKLSTEDFRIYDRLAIMMDAYHNHFRRTWNTLYQTSSSGQRPAGVSIRGFIHMGLQLCHHLTTHHTIEERFIFPELAERMPGFKDDEILISQHEQIHEGIEKTEKYLTACSTGEKELKMSELKEILDSYGAVLWAHLDEEVKMLGAENMRKYWTKNEILAMEW